MFLRVLLAGTVGIGATLATLRLPAAVADEAVQQASATDAPTDAPSAAATTAEPSSPQAPAGDASAAHPTHKQSALVEINGEGRAEATVKCFCVAQGTKLLAGCDGATNELRVFDASGAFLESIEATVTPEAINIAPDGSILVAGDGKLLRLSADGAVLAEGVAPHAAAMRENRQEIREEVISAHKQQSESLPQMLAAYDQAIQGIEEQLEQLAEAEDSAAQRATLQEQIELYKSAKDQMAEQYGGQDQSAELTEEKIEELVDQAISYKSAVASISATDEAVFIATRTAVGYGYDVWRLTPEFGDAEKIVTGLSGCCGQMDVQACAEGIFVAENSRHRVSRYDAAGELVGTFGQKDEGVHGFGSCCNPMNLAFGAGGVVYTAEDTTGRIKRYTADGKLLSVVGAADVVPGCKKVAIGVDATGDQVFMLDITRNQIAVLSRVSPDPTGPIVDPPTEEAAGAGGGLLRLLGIGG
ncbi:MAG TPA: hypothetical protein VEQ85_10280 [Lacipirellulaceae bacterium]|nr:hypothetical protein [Lacipirellulaceae bacterium]